MGSFRSFQQPKRGSSTASSVRPFVPVPTSSLQSLSLDGKPHLEHSLARIFILPPERHPSARSNEEQQKSSVRDVPQTSMESIFAESTQAEQRPRLGWNAAHIPLFPDPATLPSANIESTASMGQRQLMRAAGPQDVHPVSPPVLHPFMSQTMQRRERDETREQNSIPKKNTTGLPDTLKVGVESLSGISLDDVQVHYNSSKPSQVQALAYTQGATIHVGPGQEQHLAHEAWHVVQQKQGRVKPTLQIAGIKVNDDATLEDEADRIGKHVVQGKGEINRSWDAGSHMSKHIYQRAMPINRSINDGITQMVKVAVDKVDYTITSVSGKAESRRGGALRGHEGDHTTAYRTFLSMVKNQVMGKTVYDAANALADVLTEISLMPGMQLQTADYLQGSINLVKAELTAVRLAIKTPKDGDNHRNDLEDAMEKIIEIRNSIPLSSMNVSESSGGHDESGNNALLEECESRLRNARPLRYTPDQICQAMWEVFDYNPINSKLNVEIANVILQHIYSMRLTYPKLWQHLSALPPQYWLHNFFKNVVMPYRFNKIANRSRLDTIMDKVEAAVLGGNRAIKMGGSTLYNAASASPLDASGL